MSVSRQARLLFLIGKELAQKYTKALALGFISGLFLSLTFWRFAPGIRDRFFTGFERIGIVGDVSPQSLPRIVESEISTGLTTIGPDGTVLPGLATSWTSTDSGKTYVFTLRSNALWHNNKSVTASDVNYQINNVQLTPIDSTTIRASLKSPYSPFPAVVAKPLFLSGLIGFGPYKVSALRLKGNAIRSIKLSPTDTSHTKTKEYVFYHTEAEAILAYKLGEIHTLLDLSSPGDLVHWGNTKIIENTHTNRIVTLYFNVAASPLSDRGFRQGLAYGVPQKTNAEDADSPIPKTSWAYYPKIKEYTYDAAQAKKLLGNPKESSESSKLTISTFSPYLEDAESIAASWTSLGIPTDVKVVSSVPPTYQVLLSAQDVPPDPDQYPFWHSTQTATNITGYANVKIDKLLEDGRQEYSLAKRKTIYADFQRYLTEDVPAVFLYYAKTYTITRN